jgi:hypothetical protein
MNNRIKKKPLRIRRSIKAGIRIGVLILAAMTIVEIAKLAWETYQSRAGAPGGEILVLPMIILLFYTGWTARGEWIEYKRAFREAERREHHASNSWDGHYVEGND